MSTPRGGKGYAHDHGRWWSSSRKAHGGFQHGHGFRKDQWRREKRERRSRPLSWLVCLFVVWASSGGPAFVPCCERVEEQAVACGTVRCDCRPLAMRKSTLMIIVDSGRRCGKTSEVVGTDMAVGKTNPGKRTETSVQDLSGGLSACLSACWLVGLWACWLVGLRCLMQFNLMTASTVSTDRASTLRLHLAGQVVVDLFSSVIKLWRFGKANSGAAPTRTTRKKKENEKERNQKLPVCVCVPTLTHRGSSCS